MMRHTPGVNIVIGLFGAFGVLLMLGILLPAINRSYSVEPSITSASNAVQDPLNPMTFEQLQVVLNGCYRNTRSSSAASECITGALNAYAEMHKSATTDVYPNDPLITYPKRE